MRPIIFALLQVVLFSLAAAAQTVAPSAKQTSSNNGYGYGYVFAAPGVASGGTPTFHIGGGGEGILKNGLGIGAEIGYIGPIGELGNGFGVFSVNGSYHFLKENKSDKVAPLVTGGYTGFFRGGYINGVNFGGGINYWFKERVGLRFELRDNVFAQGGATHLLNIRVGVTFR